MTSAEIREAFLSYFEGRDHKRLPSASLVPAENDPSVLLTTAGMQPLKPYFTGAEQPPHPRLTSCQRCFRTTDVDQVGNTARHLTFFEMLGNFSLGDYFKQEAIGFGWELSTEGFGFDPAAIWVTVFGGDEELGLGPDEEAIEHWRALGVADQRIVQLGRADNFWQAGPSGPCGPCSEMYLDRGPDFGGPDDRPGDNTERFLEYWNHVFMGYELDEDGRMEPLPKRNIDTGLGLERMAAIQQGVGSVFETDGFRPLVELAEQLSGRAYGKNFETTRAMRIIADHARGMTFLIADGVVPSNEERGYILRRIMRRAIQQGRVLGLEPPYLGSFAERVIELMGASYPELEAERESVLRWAADEEESFGRTLDRGIELLGELVSGARERGDSRIDASEAFLLHDTYGFPYDLTRELLTAEGLSVDDQGFEELMEEQRRRARSGAAAAHPSEGRHGKALAFASSAPPTEFVGYERLAVSTSVLAAEPENGRALLKLERSPFYAEGGGQVSDAGRLRWEGGEARVTGVYRVGEDQAIEAEGGAPEPGTPVEAEVEPFARHATTCNHTATHLLHAALRELLGTHVRQAGSAVRPDKLRFDFTHGASLSAEDLRAVEDRVNEWIKAGRPVLAMQMARDEAERLGAMALFGEKYGEWVRMVEVEEISRELCGGTHVGNTAEVGIFAIASEGSSAANVRRIEALTGPAAIDWFRERSATLDAIGEVLGGSGDPLAAARRAAEQVEALEVGARAQRSERARNEAERLAAQAAEIGGVKVCIAHGEGADQRALLELADRVKSLAGEAAVVIGGAEEGRVGIVACFSDKAVKMGLSAVEVVREAAAVVGGGGGGRESVAQAGGRNPEKLDEALAVAQASIERALGG